MVIQIDVINNTLAINFFYHILNLPYSRDS